MSNHEKINYLEIPAKNLESVKQFFSVVFNWSFIDYGDEYCAFSNAGIEGGFYKSEQCNSPQNGSVLIVFYSDNLIETQEKIERHGGNISKPVFSFPGGKRFHFNDPCGNQFAVWSAIDN